MNIQPSICKLVNFVELPPNLQNAGSDETQCSHGIRKPSKENQTRILPFLRRHNLPRYRKSGERPKAYKHPTGREHLPVVLGLAHLPNTNGAQAQVAATHKSEDDGKDDKYGSGITGGEPECETRNYAEGDRYDEGIYSTQNVGYEAGEEAAKDGAGV